MSMHDVAIIGGGIAGCSAALHLSLRKASVVLIERRACGSEASGVNFGGVRQQGRHPSELPLSLRSQKIWRNLPELIGTDCEYNQTGHLKLAVSQEEMAELESYADQVREYGLELEVLGLLELRRRFPWLGKKVVGGSYCPGDGSANPRLVAPAFARAARAAGADIREGVTASDLIHDGKYFQIRASDGSKLSARNLINAAGAWGAGVAAIFGEQVPEEVIAPNMCVTDPVPYFLVPNLGVCGGFIYLRQIPRGNLIFGGARSSASLRAIKVFSPADVTQKLVQLAVELVPRLATALLIRTWSGIEGRMPDGLPVIDLSKTTPGLVHAFGFSGHGFQLGPAVGAVLCELALDGETDTMIDAFHIDRFQALKGQ